MHIDPSETPAFPPAATAASLVPPPLPTSPGPAAVVPASPRAIRWVELALLLAVAFGPPLYAALAVFAGFQSAGATGSQRWLFSLLHEVTALGLCAYLLHKQGRSFRELGLTLRWFDPFLGIGIMILGLLATYSVTCGLYFSGHYSAADRASQAASVSHLTNAGFGWGMVVFLVVNGFFEELIVRAYLMTDLSFLTGSTALAVIASAVFQGSYHLYQGWQAAAAVTVGFLVFALFYAQTRRITPVIIAHMLWDLCLFASYIYGSSHRLH